MVLALKSQDSVCTDSIVQPVTQLFNASLQYQIFPDIWKQARIKPLPKCIGASDVKDFRPVAVTPVISKCLERLHVKYFQTVNGDDLQFAYRPKRSNEDALMLLTDNVSQHLDTNAKNYV